MSDDTGYIQRPVNERTTKFLTGTFKDQDGAIPKVRIAAVKFTLTDVDSEAVINTREDIDIKDANNGQISTAGGLTLELTPDDNVIVGAAVPLGGLERHRLLIKWTYDTTREGNIEIFFSVRNLSKVP